MATVFKTIQNRLMALLDSDTYVPATYLINPTNGQPLAAFPVTLENEGDPNDDTNPLFVQQARVAAGSLGALASLATSAQLLAANTARKGLILVNTDANAVLIKYGTTASATSFSARIPGNFGQWEMPQPIYTGRIDAIWEADGSGSLYATEL